MYVFKVIVLVSFIEKEALEPVLLSYFKVS
jgi:hypothetical protein